jgi:sugar phosphate isomerase/epimerase
MPLDDLDPARLISLRQEAERRGIVLEVGTCSTRSAHLARFIEIAQISGAHVLRVTEDMRDWKPSLNDIAAEVRSVLPACRQHGITIAMENHFSLGAREMAQLVEMVGDSHFGICLDTVNSIARLEGWREVVNTLAPYAVSLHMKDAGVQRSGVGFQIEGRPLGQGMVDLPYVLAEVRRHGRDPNALLELWMDPAGDAESTVRQEERWIADSLAYMRQIVPAG